MTTFQTDPVADAFRARRARATDPVADAFRRRREQAVQPDTMPATTPPQEEDEHYIGSMAPEPPEHGAGAHVDPSQLAAANDYLGSRDIGAALRGAQPTNPQPDYAGIDRRWDKLLHPTNYGAPPAVPTVPTTDQEQAAKEAPWYVKGAATIAAPLAAGLNTAEGDWRTLAASLPWHPDIDPEQHPITEALAGSPDVQAQTDVIASKVPGIIRKPAEFLYGLPGMALDPLTVATAPLGGMAAKATLARLAPVLAGIEAEAGHGVRVAAEHIIGGASGVGSFSAADAAARADWRDPGAALKQVAEAAGSGATAGSIFGAITGAHAGYGAERVLRRASAGQRATSDVQDAYARGREAGESAPPWQAAHSPEAIRSELVGMKFRELQGLAETVGIDPEQHKTRGELVQAIENVGSAELPPEHPEPAPEHSPTLGSSPEPSPAESAAPSAPLAEGERVPLSKLELDQGEHPDAVAAQGKVDSLTRQREAAEREATDRLARMTAIRREVEQSPEVAAAQKEAARKVGGGAGVQGRRAEAKRRALDEGLANHPEYARHRGELDKINARIGELDTHIDTHEKAGEQASEQASAAAVEKYRQQVRAYPWWELEAERNRQRQNRSDGAYSDPRLDVLDSVIAEKSLEPPRQAVRVTPEGERPMGETRPATFRPPTTDFTKGAPPERLGADEARLRKQAQEPVDFTARPEPDTPHQYGSATKAGVAKLKEFVRTVPEFAIDPTFSVTDDGGLRFKDGGTYTFATPDAIGIKLAGEAKPGQRVRIDMDALKAHKVADGPLVARAAGEGSLTGAATLADQGGATSLPVTKPGPSGMPPGVRERGPKFAVELMEASRRLEATVRYKSLRYALGQFVRQMGKRDRIEVGDINSQRTVAHEIGHAVDVTVFPKVLGQRAFNLSQRVGGKLSELTQELKAVSTLMRGPITGSKNHVAYRNSALELFADWFSLYAHDPDLARKMSPEFTAGFEAKLKTVPDVRDVVEGLHRENVEPAIPKRPGGGEITTTANPPGRVMPRPDPVAYTREPIAQRAVQELVGENVRTYNAKYAGANLKTDSWAKGLSESQLEDVGALAEGIGNIRTKGDTAASVLARATPEMKRALKEYRFQQEFGRQEVDQYLRGVGVSEYLKYVEEYLGHFYVDDPKRIKLAVARFAKESPSAKKRTLPTLKEAVDLGLTPVTQNAAIVQKLWNQINWRVATNKAFLARLREITTSDGKPVIMPVATAPENWIPNHHPAIARTYAYKTDSGATMIWKGGARVHPDVAAAVSMILESPFTPSRWTNGYDALNNWSKSAKFLGSFFHDVTLRFSAQGATATLTDPFAGAVRLMKRDPLTGERRLIQGAATYGGKIRENAELLEDALQHGLTYHPPTTDQPIMPRPRALDAIAVKLRKGPFGEWTSGLAEKVGDLYEWRHNLLWGTQADLKFGAYHDVVARTLQRYPSLDPKFVKETIAARINDAFGGQEWETQLWATPGMRRAMRRVLLAPDWTVSTLKSVPGVGTAISKAGGEAPSLLSEGFRARYWSVKLASVAASAIGGQWAIYQAFGDPAKGDHPWIWQNETGNSYAIDVTPIMRRLPWHDAKDQTRHYVNIAKQAGEVLRWFQDPIHELRNKLAPVAQEAWTQLTGDEGGDFDAPWKAKHQSFWESLPGRGKHTAEVFTPFSFQDNQFALSFPMRKGMTAWKAEKALGSAFEAYGDPSLLNRLVHGGPLAVVRGAPPPTLDLPGMVRDILDAAKANGVNPALVFDEALAKTRGVFYGRFLRAIRDRNVDDALTAGKAIVRLNSTVPGIEESMKRREFKPTPEELNLIRTTLSEAGASQRRELNAHGSGAARSSESPK